MKLTILIFASTTLSLVASAAIADSNSGTAKANFRTDELSVPCVLIEEHSELLNGQFYDLILKRRGNSYNYDLTSVEPEDPVLCQRIADLADFEENDDLDNPAILVQCEIKADRNRIKVNGKHLGEGEYVASVHSGDNTVDSFSLSSDADEVEFRFDSDENAIMNGAVSIAADFIVDGDITAEIWLADATEPTVTSETISCLVEE